MAADYNAKLIADLYHQDDPGKAADICDDMAEIGDPIFPRQIFEAYKKFKHTSFSHYYIADLITFESQEVFEIIKEVSKTVEREADIIYIIEYFTKIEHFDKQITKTAFELFKTKVENNEIDSWDIESFISYFVKSGINSNEIELLLKLCFENDTISTDPRKTSIKLLLKINSKYFLNYYYENFDKIKGGKA